MDDFLREIHMSIFRQWVNLHASKEIRIYDDPKDPDIVLLKTSHVMGAISFNPQNIIELSLINQQTKESEFYLHFQMGSMKHAVDLFNEFLDAIERVASKRIKKVLLCCSGGLTTGYFADKLTAAVNIMGLDYRFGATRYTNLYRESENYDIILLAPQVAYLYPQVKAILTQRVVINIPNQIFASYNCIGLLRLIENREKDEAQVSALDDEERLEVESHEGVRVLAVALVRNSNRVHYAYRLYDDNNHILLNQEIIKYRIGVDDLVDIIDTVLARYHDIQIIGISIPGITNEGIVHLDELQGPQNIQELLTHRYPTCQIHLNSDVNCMALGYYASHPESGDMTFLFQPLSAPASCGHIINGKLVGGYKNAAGALKYVPWKPNETLYLNAIRTPDGMLEVVTQQIVTIISVLAPKTIALGAWLITDLDPLIDAIAQHVPRQLIPTIHRIHYVQEYHLRGVLMDAISNLHKKG